MCLFLINQMHNLVIKIIKKLELSLKKQFKNRRQIVGIKILGAGKYLPSRVVGNDDFEKIVETSNEWIVKRTGIEKRHINSGEFTVSMGVFAANQALKNAKISALDIDLIIFSTISADFVFPSMSNMLQGRLQASNAFAIDISCACSGFVYALDMAARYIDSGDEINNVLVVCSENMTRFVNYADRATCVLFGDGAGAVVVGRSKNKVFSVLKTDGTQAGLIYCSQNSVSNCFTSDFDVEKGKKNFEFDFFKFEADRFMHMEGSKVFRFAVGCMADSIVEVCKKAQIDLNDLDFIIPHQANSRIIDKVIKNVGVPKDKVFVNIQNIGNVSSACIPICLAQLIEQGKIKAGDKVCVVSFGSGFIYGAMVFDF